MATRPHLLDLGTIAAVTKRCVLNDGGALEGCALEIHVRNDGKSKQAYFRYNGTPFGEKRVERLLLGSLDLGLPHLRRERVACEDLVRRGESPKHHRARDQEQRRAAGMTMRQAMDEFFAYALRRRWSARTAVTNARCRHLHLDPLPIMEMQITEIRARHLDEMCLGTKWKGKGSGTASKMRSLLNSAFQYQMDKEAPVFRGPNPASWRENSALSQRLGDQLPSIHHPGPEPEEIPHIVHYLRTRHAGVPGYLTFSEAAYAYNRPYRAIANAFYKGLLTDVIPSPTPRGTNTNHLVPIESLQKVLGPFVHEPVHLGRYDVELYDRLLQLIIFTAMRVGNACGILMPRNVYNTGLTPSTLVGGLRWRNIKPDKLGGVLEYLPRRRDPNDPSKELPSEHKLGWKYPVKYHVILTDNLRTIIEEQRQRQIRYGFKLAPDDYVFIHGPSRTGFNHWNDHTLKHTAVGDHLKAAGEYLRERGLIQTEKMVPHGLRTTFTTWAARNGYSDNLIDLTLGHILPAIRANSSNWAYYHRVIEGMTDERRRMMELWEMHCLSLCQPRLVYSSASA
jgi:integrase